jgi:PAS domain S-box-containing protein
MSARTALRAAGLFGLCCLLAYACLMLRRLTGSLTPIWASNALLLAILFLSPRPAWKVWFSAGLAGILVGHLAAGSPPLRAAGLTVVNGAEVLLAAHLLVARFRRSPQPSLQQATLTYAGLAAIPAALGAAAASLFLWWAYRAPMLETLSTWGLSDYAGLITITPSTIALAMGWRSLARLEPWRFWPLLVLAVIATTIFSQTHFPYSYLVVAGLMLVSYRLGMAGAAVGLLIALIAAVTGTLQGVGPFASPSVPLSHQMLSLQLFVAIAFHLSVPVAYYRQRSEEMQAALNSALGEAQVAERKYREITEAVQDIIVQTGRDGRFLYVSPSMRALGHDPETMLGQTVFDYVHPDDSERIRSSRNGFFNGGDPPEGATFKLSVRTSDGGYRLFESRPHMIRNARGEAVALEAVMRDVTDAVAAEEALKASEERYRLLSEHMSDIVTRFGIDGVFRYLSPSVQAALGYAPEELVGQPIARIIHPDDAERTFAEFRAHRAKGPGAESFRVEFRVIRKDGSVAWMEAHPLAIFDEKTGEFVEWQDVVREIGDRKALEAELTAAKVAAEAAAEAKAEFLANMSHELRTPLTGVLGFTKLASSARGLAEPARTYVKRVDEASKALLALVNDILDFSKLEAGDVRFRREPVDFSELTRSSMRLFEAQAEDRGLHLELIDRLPAGLLLELDADRMRQVLLNLIGNAVKFTEAGGVTVRLRFDRAAGQLSVAVKDTGPGIAPERRADLFKRFSQVHDGRRRYGGTGLGLAICRGIVEAQGGEIGVSSKPGGGSCFHFSLPTRVVNARTRKTQPNRREKLSVLVADDNPDLQDLVVLFLADLAEVSVAIDGRSAVRIAGQKRFDVMLMDVRMPDLDGPQTLKRIRSGIGPNRATPAVAMTADTGAGAAQRLHDLGFAAVVFKPFSAVELISTVADVMTVRPEPEDEAAPVPMYGG